MLHQVGVGALGPVFRTYEPTRDRLIAVKVFRLDITPEQAQSLADALAVAAEAGLFHPSVVEPIAAGVEGTVAYRAEEYVAAETLDVAVRHLAPAPPEKILPLITQLAGALDFAKAAGVKHGALHPRDIFVTPDEARATGFGVVEALEQVGLRAPVRRPYSAPERVAGVTWGPAADVFSLAAITYELLTGRRPSGTGAQIGGLTGTSADAMHAVLATAMHNDPENRYPSALAFVSALEEVVYGAAEPETAAASGGVSPTHGVAAAAGAAAAATAAAVPSPRTGGAADFDDITDERDDDEGHEALLREERALEEELARQREDASGSDRLLFDADESEEAVEDLALDAPLRQDTDRFADEFSTAAAVPLMDPDLADEPAEEGPRTRFAREPGPLEAPSVEPLASTTDRYPTSAYAAAAAPAYERPRPPMLPIAITLVLALLVGFAAGYAVGVRDREVPAASAEPVAGTPPGGPPQTVTEQTIAPPEPVTEPSPAAPSTPPPAAERARGAAPTPERETTAARPRTGRVIVESTPSRAAVTVNGDWRGRTPLTLNLPLGEHDVRIVQNGYTTVREQVALSESTPNRRLTFRLRREPPAANARRGTPATAKPLAPAAATREAFTGSIFVDSRPTGARVLLDGKMVGVTPIRIPDVPVGSHIIRLQLTDHRDWSTSTRVSAGQDSRVTGSLERVR